MVPVSSNHFRSCIARASARCLQCLTFFIHVTEAEVNYFQLAIEVKQKIFGFQVSMAYTELVDVVNTCQQFLQVLAGSAFLQFLILHDQFEEFATTCKLHYQVQVFVSLNYFIDLNHVWVMQLLEYLDLSTDPLYVFFVFDF